MRLNHPAITTGLEDRGHKAGFVLAFVLLGGILGGFYAVLMPPLQVADEAAHLFRSYGISRGLCIAPELTPLPFSVRRLHQTFPPSLEKHRLVTWREIWKWRSVDLAPQNTRLVRAAATNVYSCIPYLASAAGVRVATALELSPLSLVHVGRIANLAAYVALVALALALLPDFHAFVLALALMPMSLHQAASFSADGLTIATSLLAASAVVNLSARAGTGLATREVVLLSVVMALAALCKSNVALVGLVGILPSRAFRSWPVYLASLALVVLFAVGSAILWIWLDRDNALLFAGRRMTHGVDAAANARTALEHPLWFLAAVARTVWSSGITYLEQLVGLLGYGTLPLPRWVTWLYGTVLLTAPFLGTASTSLGWKDRVIAGSVALGGCALSFFSLLLITGRSADVSSLSQVGIDGVAGRYFIPFAFPALLTLAAPCRKSWVNRFGVTVCLVAAIANVAALVEIARHYYTAERITIDTAVFDLNAPAVVPVREGIRVEQTLTPRFNRLARIDLDVATYGQSIPSGQLLANVRSESGSVARLSFPLREIADGSQVSLQLEPPIDSKGVPLRIDLALDAAPPGSVLGFYTTSGSRDLYPDGALAVDGQLLPDRDLALRAYRRGRNDSAVPNLNAPSRVSDRLGAQRDESDSP